MKELDLNALTLVLMAMKPGHVIDDENVPPGIEVNRTMTDYLIRRKKDSKILCRKANPKLAAYRALMAEAK